MVVVILIPGMMAMTPAAPVFLDILPPAITITAAVTAAVAAAVAVSMPVAGSIALRGPVAMVMVVMTVFPAFFFFGSAFPLSPFGGQRLFELFEAGHFWSSALRPVWMKLES
jgi:hypothetical protein